MKPHDRSSLLRRIILPLLLVFTLTTAHADEKSAKLIRTLSDKIASGKAYEILFTASMEERVQRRSRTDRRQRRTAITSM